MATRRPKVPKVTPSRPAAEASDGAENTASAARPAPATTSPGAAKAPAAGKAPASKAAANAPTGRTASARSAKAADAETDHQPVPAKAFSGRMLALAVVMVAITILLAPTVKVFFDKKAELDALNADIAARQAEGKALRQQVSRWQDPNYVKQQARDRINMVMPGETGYWVFGGDLPAGESSSEPGAATPDPADLPWVDSLWESITRAATD